MKKIVIPFLLFCVAFACACVLLLQPMQLVRDGSTRLTVHVGKTVPLVGIAELAGGYRCYVSESCKQKSIEKTKKVPQSLRDRKWA